MSTDNQKYFEALIEEIEHMVLGNMFGKPCGKFNKKAIIAFYQDEMVFKVGREEIKTLLLRYEGSKNWDPSGKNRAMKDWIQVPEKYKSDWKALMLQAIEFLNGQ